MDLYFLEADQPITKRYSLDAQGHLTKHPYPFVYNVTSHCEPCPDLATFERLLLKHAAQGHTLVKGELSRPLVAESRAGSTDSETKTSWICLDLDGIDQFQTVDLFLEAIGCADTDYVLQWSSSMGVENKSGFRCHIFMLLRTPTHPQLLKYWLQDLNLRIPTLKAQLSLTKTYNALRWPLDVTTCQNDKLLYIAPPRFDAGLKDPYPGNRITLHTRTHRELALPPITPTKEALRELTHKTVNDLRLAAGLPKRKSTRFKFEGTVEYYANPDSAVITETKTERGFVYFNLNGGDSWAYYHPENNPAFIFNFKGEPVYRTQDLLPEYWAQVSDRSSNYQANSQGDIYLAFRDFDSGMYWNGIYNAFRDELRLAPAKSESQLRHFMKQHGQPLGDFIPDWTMTFDPQDPTVVDPQNRVLNTYRPSELFKDSNPPHCGQVPPTIFKVLDHVLGNDPLTLDHFLNWLAVIVQNLDRTGTAWVLHGTQGTGKGLLFHSILTPLFGAWNVEAKRMEEIEGDFTGFLKDKFVLFVDEVEAGKSLYHSKVTAKLKNLIVEPMISVREMYRPAYMRRNRINMIFASNKNAPVEVDPDDRRFNVAMRQEQALQITQREVDTLETELPEFYQYLKCYPADPAKARKPLINASRSTLIATNRLAIDTVADALLAGDLEFFWDHLPSQKPVTLSMSPKQQGVYEAYRVLMIDLVTNQTPQLTRDELFTLFEWCLGNMPESSHKFTALLKHHRVPVKPVWKHNRTVRGITVTWHPDPKWLTNAQTEIANGVI